MRIEPDVAEHAPGRRWTRWSYCVPFGAVLIAACDDSSSPDNLFAPNPDDDAGADATDAARERYETSVLDQEASAPEAPIVIDAAEAALADVIDSGHSDADAGDGRPQGYVCAVGALTDSICDFSSTQGMAGWQYGYFEPAANRTFRLMQRFVPTTAGGDYFDQGIWTVGSQYWTAITAATAEPNGLMTSGNRMPAEQLPVRRWVSTVAGRIRIAITAYRQFPQSGGNGVQVSIAVDGVSVWTKVIPPMPVDAAPPQQTIEATVNVGSTVDLIVDPISSDDFVDETRFYVVIER